MNATKNNIGDTSTSRRKKTKTTAPTVGRILTMDETGKRHFRNPKRPKEISSDRTSFNGFLKTTFLPKLKENNFQKIKEEYSWPQIIDHYDDFIRKCYNGLKK